MATKTTSASRDSTRISHIGAFWALLLSTPLAWGQAAPWWPARWSDLPDWGSDAVEQLWPQLRQQCQKPRPAWLRWCRQLPAQPLDALQAHGWLMQTLQPYRVGGDDATGLLTGYFEPQLTARRQRDERFHVPLLDARRQPLLYLDDPLDAVLLQVQGSGRVSVSEPDGRVRERRVAWAGHNQQPFRSLAAWLIEQGALREGQASWRAVRAWGLQNPERIAELLAANPRVVYFREEALDDPAVGPRGAMGWPLTPQRSVAVDPRAVPYGTPLWIDSELPLSSQPLRRLVLAQDTGSAIVGSVRADYFWGWGDAAFAQAGRTKQPLRWWALWPKDERTP